MLQFLAFLVLLLCACAKPQSRKETQFTPLVKVSGEASEDEQYGCTRCRWAAKMIRASLSEKSLPKKPKDAAKRRGMVEIALAESDDLEDTGVCARNKFPKDVKERQERETMRITYVDAEQPQEANVRYRSIEQGIEGVIDKMAQACEEILSAVRTEAGKRAFDFTAKVDKFTVGSAFTDRWVCHRATGLCPNVDFPELDEDEEEEDGEL
eukprot:gnl/MRDRNA2_/MRDRNA2_120254_c0_seq1.p1 gnl/MRDRNA2_/MRDRNA2_120254_c0~~gnl/MRDRNA2_/MRDRNA2_120254_c0_seq1.p1  ORF type:complete len:210 (-),score=50.49 gnl/MRDRNA2_/MRDRNA2_120254_c0_seq1:135-764(-)